MKNRRQTVMPAPGFDEQNFSDTLEELDVVEDPWGSINEDYTEAERHSIKQMRSDGRLADTCPCCNQFWLRDYSFPVRRCPCCGFIKPWAEKGLAWR